MLTIEWGELRPSSAERAEIEARIGAIELSVPSTLSLRRNDSGIEATLRVAVAAGPTEVRLMGPDALAAVRRVVALLEAVADERRRSG